MKKTRILIFKILILLTIIFSIGSDSNFIFEGGVYSIVTLSDVNDNDSSIGSDFDPYTHDQINQDHKPEIISQPISIAFITTDRFIANYLYSVVWQPPKTL